MDRRTLIAAGAAAAGLAAVTGARAENQPDETPPPPAAPPEQPAPQGPPTDQATPAGSVPPDQPAPPAEDNSPGPPRPEVRPEYPARTPAETYSRSEMVNGVSDFLGVSAESAAAAIEKIFKDNGRPTAYISGEEGSITFFGGLRYGKGLLYMKNRPPTQVFWRGPSIGFDWGGNASRSFTLCYNLQYPEMIFRRFPGVDGSAYFIGGLGVNYQRAEGVTLAPVRAGVGLRLGASVGYLAYSRSRSYFPF